MILAEELTAKEKAEFVMVEIEKEEELKDYEVLDFGGKGQELMLHVVRRMAKPHTLKIKGNIVGLLVLGLIDGGANHNFISKDIANKLKMKEEQENSFWMRLGDGERKQTARICKSVTLSLEGVKIIANFHVFPLGGVNLILGVAWLKTLGNVNLNWDTLYGI